MKRLSYCLIVLSCVISVAGSAFGQGFPMPTAPGGTMVTCPGCPPMHTGVDPISSQPIVGNPPYPYSDPIVAFTGRYLDSTFNRDWQQAFRTARAFNVQVNEQKNRIYLHMGSAVTAYKLDTFFTRLEARENLRSALNVVPGNTMHHNNEIEYFLAWDKFFYAENTPTTPVKWFTPITDGQERLYAYDFDDRGYIYMAYSYFGWGIAQDDFSADGGLMASLYQSPADTWIPGVAIPIKTSAGRYYVMIGDANQPIMRIYDTTNPSAPVLAGQFPRLHQTYARTADRFAAVGRDSKLYIYANDSILTGGTPLKTLSMPGNGSYTSVTTDGINFYATASTPGNGGGIINVLTRTATGDFTEQTTTLPVGFSPFDINYGSGYAAVLGRGSRGEDVLLYRIVNGTPTEVSLNGYFNKHYAAEQPGHTRPPRAQLASIVPYRNGAKLHLVVAAYGLGDVYQIKSEDAIAVGIQGTVGGVNPNAPIRTAGDIFYGDTVSVMATTSGTPKSVSWNFGNPEAGVQNIDPNGQTGVPKLYQYSGLTPSTLGVKTITGTAPAASSSVTLTLKPPVARFGVTGINFLFTQANASSPAPIIVGDSFFDASDGDLNGHYAAWSLDGTAPVYSAPATAVSVGGCGAHTLDFTTHYGPYSSLGVPVGTNYQVGLVPLNGSTTFRYGVQPFAAAINPPSPVGGNLIFTSASRFNPAAASSFTHQWDLLDGNGNPVVGSSQSGSGFPSGSFNVAQASLGPNYRVRLTITSPPTATVCPGFTQSVAVTAPLNKPDPVIAGGCAVDSGPPCNFTAASASGASTAGWTFAWSAPGATPNAGTGPTFSPVFTQVGQYVVTLTATRDGLSNSVSQPLSITKVGSTCPAMVPGVNVFVNYTGNSSNCRAGAGGTNCSAGEQITFSIGTFLDYAIGCANHTYQWSFSNGASGGSSPTVSQSFQPGSYVATCVLSNGAESKTLTQQFTVGGGPVDPGPGSGSCPQMNPLNVFIGYQGSGCNQLNGECAANQTVTFTATAFPPYSFSCGPHTFNWTIDGQPKSGQIVTHSFPSGGTYAVQLSINNGSQVYPLQATVKVAGGPVGGSCGQMNNGNTFLTFSNPNGSCGVNSPNPCGVGENITFGVSTSGYNLACANHTFNWNFAGATQAGGSSITRSFSSANTYAVSVTINNTTTGQTFTTAPVNVAVGQQNTNPGSCPQMNGINVFIGFRNPSNSCNQNPGAGPCGTNEPITFEAMGFNYDFSCGSHSYTWDFPGGVQKTGKIVTHTFPGVGSFPVKLTINNGQNIELFHTINVGTTGNPGIPEVDLDFTTMPMPGVANGYIFTPSVSGAEVAKWVWNFGDGRGDTIDLPGSTGVTSHIYSQAGDYTVTLRVFNASGQELKSHTEKTSDTGPPARRRGVRH